MPQPRSRKSPGGARLCKRAARCAATAHAVACSSGSSAKSITSAWGNLAAARRRRRACVSRSAASSAAKVRRKAADCASSALSGKSAAASAASACWARGLRRNASCASCARASAGIRGAGVMRPRQSLRRMAEGLRPGSAAPCSDGGCRDQPRVARASPARILPHLAQPSKILSQNGCCRLQFWKESRYECS